MIRVMGKNYNKEACFWEKFNNKSKTPEQVKHKAKRVIRLAVAHTASATTVPLRDDSAISAPDCMYDEDCRAAAEQQAAAAV